MFSKTTFLFLEFTLEEKTIRYQKKIGKMTNILGIKFPVLLGNFLYFLFYEKKILKLKKNHYTNSIELQIKQTKIYKNKNVI